MKGSKLTVFLIVTTLLFAMVMAGPFSSEAATHGRYMEIDVEGPETPFVNITEEYTVTITGEFEDGSSVEEVAENWTLNAQTDLDATIEPEEQENETSNVFQVEVQIHEETEGELIFTAYAGKEGDVEFTEKQFNVDPEKPERTSLVIENPTDMHIDEANLGLFINDELKDVQTVQDLEPEGEQTITFQWSKRDLEGGEHQMEVWMEYREREIDDEINQDQLVLSRTFEVEEETSTLLIAGIVLAVIAVSLVVFLWYQKKRRESRRPW